MPYGYNGKMLHVNLSSATLTIEEPSEEFYRKYMGGSALNLYYLPRQEVITTGKSSAIFTVTVMLSFLLRMLNEYLRLIR